MAVVPGDTKLCTRRNFNSNVVSYFTNDDKVLTRRDIGVGTFVVGDYKYTLSSSVTDLNTCMTCKNITYTKTENDPTIMYTIHFSELQFDPYYIRDNGEWENQNGGMCVCYSTIYLYAYDTNGNVLHNQDLTVVIEGERNGIQIYITGGYIYETPQFTTKKSNPCTRCTLDYGDRPIIAISQGSEIKVTGTASNNTITWQLIRFELEA